ncbi:MAG: sel1 repeat family protein [Deltaproteobacteria bacterium]|nr:sel1 repeat family protein [Deltaproteobacteria bacterium]
MAASSLQLSAIKFPTQGRPDVGNRATAEEMYQLGLFHLAGDALPATLTLGVAYLKRAAGMGHVGAHFELGQAYRFGRGVDEDMDTAWACYLFAATHGHAGAAMVLAHAFYSLARECHP